ncbi:hypothetical protein CULT_10143 [[Clostridium] ultunense Esp]|nr:hypothetical protein CULT_10143 [[Clostridium] ultunense Esp]
MSMYIFDDNGGVKLATYHKHQVLELAEVIEEMTSQLDQFEDWEKVTFNFRQSSHFRSFPDSLKDAMQHLLTVLRKREQKMSHPYEAIKRNEALQQLTLEIASLAPLKQVLHRICETIRLLLHTDIGYLALYDEEKQTITISATSGTSPNIIGVEQRLGNGIGGRVVLTKRPHMFTDYRKETRRDPEVENAIDREGIISGLAVPLLLGTHAVGVLYAAMRTHREFNEEETEFLTSLASLASVAIQNARLYERSQRLIQIHQQLTEAVLQGDAIPSLIRSLSVILSSDVYFVDLSGEMTYSSLQNRLLNQDNLTELSQFVLTHYAKDSSHKSFIFNLNDLKLLCALVINNDVVVGPLMTVRPHSATYDDIDQIAIERAALLLALVISRSEVRKMNQFHLRTALLYQLLLKSEHEAVLSERAKHLGFNLYSPSLLIVNICSVDSLPPSQQENINRILRSILFSLDPEKYPLATVDNGNLIIAVKNQETIEKNAEEVYSLIKSSLPHVKVYTVISDLCHIPNDYRSAYLKSLNALSWHLKLGHSGTIIWAKSFGLAGLLFDASNFDAIKTFVLETFSPFKEYPSAHELLETLKIYLENECELRSTSEILHIHYNTLRHRIDRIEQILKISLKDAKIRQKLRLALLLNDTFHFV